jgi:hypothetical protein
MRIFWSSKFVAYKKQESTGFGFLLLFYFMIFCQSAAAETLDGSIYTFAVQPFTMEECASCHSTHYNLRVITHPERLLLLQGFVHFLQPVITDVFGGTGLIYGGADFFYCGIGGLIGYLLYSALLIGLLLIVF